MLTELLQLQLGRSLERVEESLGRWRQGELGPFEAHAEVLKHAARAERIAGRLAQASQGDAKTSLRDALDAGVIDRDEFVELTGVDPSEVEPSVDLDDSDEFPLKPDVVRELLERGPVLVHVDARSHGVSVPPHLKHDPKLVLRFGYGLTPAIHDLELDDSALSGTLTFGGVPHHCVLPWPGVYAVVSEADQQGMVWPQDVPTMVLQEMATESDITGRQPPASMGPPRQTPARSDKPKSAKRRASHLKLVE